MNNTAGMNGLVPPRGVLLDLAFHPLRAGRVPRHAFIHAPRPLLDRLVAAAVTRLPFGGHLAGTDGAPVAPIPADEQPPRRGTPEFDADTARRRHQHVIEELSAPDGDAGGRRVEVLAAPIGYYYDAVGRLGRVGAAVIAVPDDGDIKNPAWRAVASAVGGMLAPGGRVLLGGSDRVVEAVVAFVRLRRSVVGRMVGLGGGWVLAGR